VVVYDTDDCSVFNINKCKRVVLAQTTIKATLMIFHDMLEHGSRGEPIWISTRSSHCNGPFRWISIQHGVLVIVCRLTNAHTILLSITGNPVMCVSYVTTPVWAPVSIMNPNCLMVMVYKGTINQASVSLASVYGHLSKCLAFLFRFARSVKWLVWIQLCYHQPTDWFVRCGLYNHNKTSEALQH